MNCQKIRMQAMAIPTSTPKRLARKVPKPSRFLVSSEVSMERRTWVRCVAGKTRDWRVKNKRWEMEVREAKEAGRFSAVVNSVSSISKTVVAKLR